MGGFGGSSAGRAGFSERMQKMTAPSKPMPHVSACSAHVSMQRHGSGYAVWRRKSSWYATQAQRLGPSFGHAILVLKLQNSIFRISRDVSNSALPQAAGVA